MKNDTIQTILQHRSIRKFTEQNLTKEQIHTIVRAAQQASSSSYIMAYTIIGVTDDRTKEQLAQISGQPYVKNNGHLFVFCADLHRIYEQTKDAKEEAVQENLESTEQFIVSTVDASLAAQNAAIAAESMGLGICYIGSLRNNIKKVDELLALPPYVYPLFGLAVGYPDQQPEKKPRFPIDVVYHENTYDHDQEKQKRLLKGFEQDIKAYYETRSMNVRTDTWTDQMIRKFRIPTRMDVSGYIKQKGLNRR